MIIDYCARCIGKVDRQIYNPCGMIAGTPRGRLRHVGAAVLLDDIDTAIGEVIAGYRAR